MWWTTLLLVCTTFKSAYSQSQNPVVRTSKGIVEGLNVDPSPATGVSYRAFLGIPYADKPKRFQLPQARSPWQGHLMTQEDGPACPQPGRPFNEDCLYLNVFSPLEANTTSRLPVMVFIHGSAFTYGSSSSRHLGPDFLVNQSVILVTLNYRLGAAGYLTLGTAEAPGNLGLYDSLLALQWVQQEITQFGGDPMQVTLFGQSAGGIIIHYLYMSKLSIGMFSKVITESGCALMDSGHVWLAEGVRRAKMLAKAVGCNTNTDNSTLLRCLQTVNISAIVDSQSIPLSDQLMISGNPLTFVPVRDDYHILDKPVFYDSFENMMQAALNRSIPLIIGFNTDEGILRFEEGIPWQKAESNLDAFIPLDVLPLVSEQTKVSLVNSIRDMYFPDTFDENKIEDLVRLYTDTSFAYASVKTSRAYASVAYGYLFAYQGTWADSPKVFSQFKLSGVNHGDEMPYLFYGSGQQYFNATPPNILNLEMRDMMVQLWTDFAKTGVPSTSWKKISAGGYLVIDEFTRKVDVTTFENKYYKFWADIEERAKSATQSVASTFSNSVSVISLTVACTVRRLF